MNMISPSILHTSHLTQKQRCTHAQIAYTGLASLINNLHPVTRSRFCDVAFFALSEENCMSQLRSHVFRTWSNHLIETKMDNEHHLPIHFSYHPYIKTTAVRDCAYAQDVSTIFDWHYKKPTHPDWVKILRCCIFRFK